MPPCTLKERSVLYWSEQFHLLCLPRGSGEHSGALIQRAIQAAHCCKAELIGEDGAKRNILLQLIIYCREREKLVMFGL